MNPFENTTYLGEFVKDSPKVSETERLKKAMEDQMSYSWTDISRFLARANHLPKDSIDSGYYDGNAREAWRTEWLDSKLHIFKAFGEKLRIEKEVELDLNDRDISDSLSAMITSLATKVKLSTAQIIALAISSLKKSDIVDNKLSQKTNLFGIEFGKGMKVSKALGRLIKDNKEVDIFQTEFSKTLQSFKATGTLVISIDPIDIITMSYSPSNSWRSCHNIVDGEYRAGALAYVCDSSTFISYVYRSKSKSPYTGDLELPNKTWRMIGYMAKGQELIAFSCHYPSQNKSNSGTMRTLLAEAMGLDNPACGYIQGEDGFFENWFYDEGEYHYNDIIHGRISRSYVMDLQGVTKEASGSTFEDKIYDYYVSKGERVDRPKFYVGVTDLNAFDGGYVHNSGTIMSDGDYDD